MRRQMVQLAMLVIAAAPMYATDINPALASYYAALGIGVQPSVSQVVSQPAQVSSPVVNTTSPYSGFNSSGTPTNSYMGTVASVVSPAPTTGNSSLDAYYRSLGITSTIVNSTTTTTTPQYTPQVITTAPSSSSPGTSVGGMSPTMLAYYHSLGMYLNVTSTPSTVVSSPQGPVVITASNPEPATILMMAGGLGAVILLRKKLQSKA